MGAKFKTAIKVIVAAAAFGFLGTIDYSEALIQDAIEKQQRPLRVIASYQTLPLGFPLDYDAIVCQGGQCRYYSRNKSK